MLKIYGSARSSAGRCIWCLEEVEAQYENVSVNFREREHLSENYLNLNPNGKIPTLVDGDFKVWESVAINSYLAELHRPDLLGKSAKDRALVQQWGIWSMAELQAPMIEVFIQLVFVPEDKRDAKVIEKNQGKLPRLLTALDKSLEGKTYLVGEEFSLADLNVASVVNLHEEIKYDISSYKNVNKWLKLVCSRPAFNKYKEMIG